MGYPEQIKAWENIPTDDYLAKAQGPGRQLRRRGHLQDGPRLGYEVPDDHVEAPRRFAMWDTKTTDYNIVKQSNYGKDPMKELSTECQQARA